MELLRLIILDSSYETDDLTFTLSCGAKASARLTADAVHLQSVMEFSLR